MKKLYAILSILILLTLFTTTSCNKSERAEKVVKVNEQTNLASTETNLDELFNEAYVQVNDFVEKYDNQNHSYVYLSDSEEDVEYSEIRLCCSSEIFISKWIIIEKRPEDYKNQKAIGYSLSKDKSGKHYILETSFFKHNQEVKSERETATITTTEDMGLALDVIYKRLQESKDNISNTETKIEKMLENG